MPFNDLTDSLNQGFLHTIASRRAVKLIDGKKPVKGYQNFPFLGQIVAPGPFQRQAFKYFSGNSQVIGFIMDRLGNEFKSNGPVLDVGIYIGNEIFRILGKTEKAESFR